MYFKDKRELKFMSRSIQQVFTYGERWCVVTMHVGCWQFSSKIHNCICNCSAWRRNVCKSLLFSDWNSHRYNRARPSAPGHQCDTTSWHLCQHPPRLYFAKCLKKKTSAGNTSICEYEYFFCALMMRRWSWKTFRRYHNWHQIHNAVCQHDETLNACAY